MRPSVLRALLILLVFDAGCLTAGDCERRVRAARRDGLRDAAICQFDPAGLDHEDCNTEQTPTLAYYGMWCATAEPTCIREDADATAVCFGRSTDTGSAPAIQRIAWPTP